MSDPSNVHRKRGECRVCGGNRLTGFLQLGPTPLANSFLASPEEFCREVSYPLDLYFCETCTLIQLLDVIDPAILFRNYIYVTGTSDTISEHNRRYARGVIELLGLGPKSCVVEVASNDGSLLECFRACGVQTLGVEPATNIAAIARSRGIETVNEFFGLAVAENLRESRGAVDVVVANNVVAHVDGVREFMAGCRHLLKPEGAVIIEVPYLSELIDRLEYDTVYHEHLSYFSMTALLRLYDEAGLSVFRVDRVPVHGGSLRVYAGRREHYRSHGDGALRLAKEEADSGLTQLARFERFARDVACNREAIREFLNDLKESGRSVAGYGAPAKGNTLLNYCGVDASLLPYTVDKSSMKVNLYTPGMHIPVRPVSTLLEEQPDYVFLLAWNFSEEILRQQSEYRNRGGRFIVPIPKPQVV